MLNPASALLLLALIHPMFACVIPVAPDFQDPLAAANSPPAIIGSEPLFNSVVSIAPSLQFRISVIDPNVNDSLYARWVIDYPPFQPATFTIADQQFQPPATGAVHSETPTLPLKCSSGFGAVTTPQRLAVYVADRMFQDNSAANNNRLDITQPGGYVAFGSWTVVFQCPPISSGAL
ncbi:MAG TPA: hypothetical protein VHH90_05620 [Polyangia bacterium]|nr:hypothetical protein [Polyangia bacterium]